MDAVRFNRWIFFIFAIVSSVVQCLIEKQTFTLDNGSGQFSDFIIAQPELGSDPTQTLLCGYAVRQMRWIKQLYNCNCGNKIESLTSVAYKCEWCDNIFWSMKNGFKAIYCNINNWSNQKTKLFETGNKDGRNWKEYKCPKDTFVSNVVVKMGRELETELGFVGMQITCSTLDMSQSFIIQENSKCVTSQQSTNSHGTFVSAVNIRSKKDGQLTGIKLNFEGAPMISEIVVKHKDVEILNSTQKTIESMVVSNMEKFTVRKTVAFTKPYSIINIWLASIPYMKGYKLSSNFSVNPPQSKLDKTETFPYEIVTDAFKFDTQILTKFNPTSPIMIVTPRYTNITLSTKIMQSRAKSIFEASVSFIDRLTKQLIAEKVITGTWDGIITSPVFVGFEQSQCTGMQANNNLVTNGNFQDTKCNITWCLWGEKNYSQFYLPGWIPNPEIEMSKAENYNKVLGTG